MTIATDSEHLQRQLERMYGPYLSVEAEAGERWLQVRSGGRGAPERFHVEDSGASGSELAVDRGGMLTWVRERVQYHLVDEQACYLMVHGAGLALERGGVLFPAASGAGKTTLTAWLIGSGLRPLADELVAVDQDGRMTGFRQPMNVKRTGLELIGSLPWMGPMISAALDVATGRLLPWVEPEAPAAVPAVAVVFPRYVPGADLSIEPMSSGRATAHLLETVINARNLERGGIGHAAAVCRGVPAWSMRYSDLAPVGDWLVERFGVPRRPAEQDAGPGLS